MEAQGGAPSPELGKNIQKLLKPSSSGKLSQEQFQQHAAGEEEEGEEEEEEDEEEGGWTGPTASLLHISEKRQPLSSVSSLEVHFDLLDLTELTDMSDQELAEVFADSDEENHNECPPGSQQVVLGKGGYMRSPSWTRCSKVEMPRERKHHSDSDTTAEPFMKLERPKQP
ncbi:dysbindin domain-containing protein 1 isoform X2 [Hippocampus comes]|uniref:dysbindin domain-containing protein 1 isoform X1 n=1 Tax=Hippocampus comes TaxID=109280 RepID=UPI00094EAF3B|nr:PREDICTED: dysbindin domain-containing protein 1 isoform X1 [Hippocampus comes]XP_019751363.1 PREDICTED: dysbindin domain-containing protein 1 isoform X2 [Hippocampus comes]